MNLLLGGFVEAWGKGLGAWQALAGMGDAGLSDPGAGRAATTAPIEAMAKAFDPARQQGAGEADSQAAGMSWSVASALERANRMIPGSRRESNSATGIVSGVLLPASK